MGFNVSIYGFKVGVVYIVFKVGVMVLIKNMVGFYGLKGIYSIVLFLGGMNINIIDVFVKGMYMEVF